MKIYLAGVISPGDWREQVVDKKLLTIDPAYIRQQDEGGGTYHWPIRERALWGRFDYTGPYLLDYGEEDDGSVIGFFASLAAEYSAGEKPANGIYAADVVFVFFPAGAQNSQLLLDMAYATGRNKILYVALHPDAEVEGNVVRFFMEMGDNETIKCTEPGQSLYEMMLAGGWYCQSPIERAFWFAGSHLLCGLEPQYQVGPYFADFALPRLRLAIEMDGHEFHCTKEQRTRDAKRDRFFMEQGWQVIRFTGTEIHANVKKCVQQVQTIAKLRE